MSHDHPPKPTTDGPLKDLWNRPVSELVTLSNPVIPGPDQERHRIYCLLVMSLVHHYWNGNRRGRQGRYNYNRAQPAVHTDYIGHNIGAIAVDGRGEIIDFDFNHNEVLRSSVEHAESRLIRRVFSLTQIYDDWATRKPSDPPKSTSYANLLGDVTIYTSLEPCAQCAGIMALGSVKDVVFLQRDPGQNSIGNILRNLVPGSSRYRPPLPIPADSVGSPYFDKLNAGFDKFVQDIKNTPFFEGVDGYKDHSPAITSYLCTDDAYGLYAHAAQQFTTLQLLQPDHAPVSGAPPEKQPLTNSGALEHARRFRNYAVSCGYRGTPHRL